MRGLREYPEPGPRRAGPRILALQGIGHAHATAAGLLITDPKYVGAGDLAAHRGDKTLGQHDDPILATLALAHDDGQAIEINVFDAQLQTLADPHAGAVE